LRLHPEELPEQDPMGLDPQEGFAKMYKDRVWKISLGLRFRYSMP
jgi:hypothetical protein